MNRRLTRPINEVAEFILYSLSNPYPKFEWCELCSSADTSEAHLKPMNAAKWTEIDGAIDKVLRAVRSVNPDTQTSKSASEALLVTLNKQ